MATNTLKTIIQLRRDTAENFDKIGTSYIPRKGEVVLVDTASDGLRAKVGDGESKYSQLGFADQNLRDTIDNVVVRGYYFNGKFYTDSTYTVELGLSLNRIYIDISTKVVYSYDGSEFVSVNDTLPTASDLIPGISKLYKTSGQNEDGSMTQKSITNGVAAIQFDIDKDDSECLVLDLPW